MCSNFSVTWMKKKLEIKLNNKININIQKCKKKTFVIIFLARVLSIPKKIDNITKNKW